MTNRQLEKMDVDLDDLFDTEPTENLDDIADTLLADGVGASVENELVDDVTGEDATDPQTENKPDDVDVDVSSGQPGKKKRVSRPQPKLNGDRLLGTRGIAILRRTFSTVRFQGRGHERSDLKLLMAKLEHWSHRMFPKMPFDDALERIEKLGKTKQIQVNVKKMRMGIDVMPTEVRDGGDADGDGDSTVRGDSESQPQMDVFDELLQAHPMPPPVVPSGDSQLPEEEALSSSPQRPSQSGSAASPGLSVEQRERIRRNRELAQLRRMRAKFTDQASAAANVVEEMPTEVEKIPADVEDNPAEVVKIPAEVDKMSAEVVKMSAEVVKMSAEVEKVSAEVASDAPSGGSLFSSDRPLVLSDVDDCDMLAAGSLSSFEDRQEATRSSARNESDDMDVGDGAEGDVVVSLTSSSSSLLEVDGGDDRRRRATSPASSSSSVQEVPDVGGSLDSPRLESPAFHGSAVLKEADTVDVTDGSAVSDGGAELDAPTGT